MPCKGNCSLDLVSHTTLTLLHGVCLTVPGFRARLAQPVSPSVLPQVSALLTAGLPLLGRERSPW